MTHAAGERTFLVTASRAWTRAEIERVASGAGLTAASEARSVALDLRDATRTCLALAALAGRAERLVLVPDGLETEVRAALLRESGARALVTDRAPGDVPPSLRTILWSREPELGASTEPLRSEPWSSEWVLATTGTTGKPKLVVHTSASLTRALSRDKERGHAQRWGLLYELTRFAGLQVFLQALLSEATLIAPDSEATLAERLALFREAGCNALSATPTLWRKILMAPGSRELGLRQVTLGGEIADAPVLKALRAHYPEARIAHIYASTEAGAAFSVADGEAGFPAAFLEDPPRGVGLRVIDGRLHVHNPAVAPRYLASDQAFADDEGWVDTGDEVRVAGDRVLFLGRASGVINVGGDKVYPEEVESVLLEHPEVELARVHSLPSPITGALVAAELVLSAGADEAKVKSELISACRERLQRWQTPARLRVVENLEAGPAGKLGRRMRATT